MIARAASFSPIHIFVSDREKQRHARNRNDTLKAPVPRLVDTVPVATHSSCITPELVQESAPKPLCPTELSHGRKEEECQTQLKGSE